MRNTVKKTLLNATIAAILGAPIGATAIAEELEPAMVEASPEEMSQYLTESRELSKTLFSELKQTMRNAMNTGGPEKAIAVCSHRAQTITNGVSSKRTGLRIHRTSLRLRNQKNSPDAWEIKILEQFDARAAAGEGLDNMEYYGVVGNGDSRVFRYMKAIPTSKPCMTCHGEFVSKDILQQIRDIYPLEQATGFKQGELRGAFSVTKELD